MMDTLFSTISSAYFSSKKKKKIGIILLLIKKLESLQVFVYYQYQQIHYHLLGKCFIIYDD